MCSSADVGAPRIAEMKKPQLRRLHNTTAALVLLLVNTLAWAQTTVSEPWVRGTVPQQKATGAFMQITSAKGGKLISVSTPAAGVAEIHEMTMEGSMMKMRALPSLALPAGKAVELKPGGHHLMLMDLKAPLKAGDTVVLTLVIEGSNGQREQVEIKAPVKALGSSSAHQH